MLTVIAIHGIAALDLTILHTNDVHTRFEQTDAYASECTDELEATGLCYGGVARRMTKIKVWLTISDSLNLFQHVPAVLRFSLLH